MGYGNVCPAERGVRGERSFHLGWLPETIWVRCDPTGWVQQQQQQQQHEWQLCTLGGRHWGSGVPGGSSLLLLPLLAKVIHLSFLLWLHAFSLMFKGQFQPKGLLYLYLYVMLSCLSMFLRTILLLMSPIWIDLKVLFEFRMCMVIDAIQWLQCGNYSFLS